MMAFFLLMWLLAFVPEEVLKGISEYFENPWKPSMAGGSGTGDATSIINGGGEDITRSRGQVKLTNTGKVDVVTEAAEEEIRQLEALKAKIEAMIDTNPLLGQFKNQLRIDITEEGLRIQIVDEEKRPMFALASTRMEPYAAQILQQIAPVINELSNKISIAGHTDARPFPGDGKGYSNWELSADRSNEARRALIKGGYSEDKIMRVTGLASSVPLIAEQPLDPANRRISIIVMNKRTEQEIRNSASIDVSEKLPLNPEAVEAKVPPAQGH
jgi:chemotaxis protein MotB